MVRRAISQGEVEEQVRRLAGLTDQLKDAVHGIKQGKGLIRKLQSKLEDETRTLSRTCETTFEKVLSEEKASSSQLRLRQEEQVRKLIRESGEALGALTDSLSRRMEDASSKMKQLEREAKSSVTEVKKEWAAFQGKEAQFEKSVEQRLENMLQRVTSCDSAVQEMTRVLTKAADRQRNLETTTDELRSQLSRVEERIENQRSAADQQWSRFRWWLSVITVALLGLGIVVVAQGAA